MKPEEDDDFDNHARFKGRFRAYDKVYYGDGFIGSHVLDIVDVTTDDLGAYKVEVYLPARKVGNEAIIELRHKGGCCILDLPFDIERQILSNAVCL